jgi:hypothetical protein
LGVLGIGVYVRVEYGGCIPNFSYFKKKMKKDLVVREKGVISTYE